MLKLRKGEKRKVQQWFLLTVFLLGSGLSMGCNQSFTSSTDAVIHDSDPRLLRFNQFQGDNPIVDLGTLLDMSLIKAPGLLPPVLGPVIGDLTGGAANTIAFECTPPAPTFDSLTGGSILFTFTLDDSTTAGPFALTYADLIAIADSLGQGANSTLSFDMQSVNFPIWTFSPLIGRTIVSYTYDVVGFTATPNPIANGTTSLRMGWNGSDTYPSNLAISGSGNFQAWSIGGWGLVEPLFNFTMTLGGSAPNTTLTLLLDAATLISLATGPQLLLQNVGIHYPSAFFTSLIGYTIISATYHLPDVYGPGTVQPPSYLVGNYESGYGSGNSDIPPPQQMTSSNADLTILLSEQPITATTAFNAKIRLFPSDAPAAIGPIVATEDYEIRQRNQAGFRINVIPPPGYIGESISFLVYAYGSQGETAGQKLWAPVSNTVFDETSVRQASNQFLVNAPDHVVGMPDEYGGTMISLGNGANPDWPCNYVRLFFFPIVLDPPSLIGWQLQVTANAREI